MDTNTRNRWKVCLQLESPMQIGAGTLGMIEKTELYIPGRVIWGGLTNTLVALYGRGFAEDYEEAGEALGLYGSHCASFFPSFNGGESVFRPRFSLNSGARVWEDSQNSNVKKTEEELAQVLLFTVTSTAYSPYQDDTDEENKMLHATDMISHIIQSSSEGGAFINLCYQGMIDLPGQINLGSEKIGITAETLAECFNKTRLGGGRKRGWGLVSCKKLEKVVDTSSSLHESIYERGEGRYRWLLAPSFSCSDIPEAQGRVFRATYRIYEKNSAQTGFGQAFTSPHMCWETGTLVPEKNLTSS